MNIKSKCFRDTNYSLIAKRLHRSVTYESQVSIQRGTVRLMSDRCVYSIRLQRHSRGESTEEDSVKRKAKKSDDAL